MAASPRLRTPRKVFSMRLKGPSGCATDGDGRRYRGNGNYGRTNGPREDPGGVRSLFSRKAAAQWAAIPHAAIADITSPPLIGCSYSGYIGPQDKSLDTGKKAHGISGCSPTSPRNLGIYVQSRNRDGGRSTIADKDDDSSLDQSRATMRSFFNVDGETFCRVNRFIVFG